MCALEKDPGARDGRVLVLGLGNTILTDDGIGIYVVRRVAELLGPEEPIDVEEAELAGFALLDLLEGFDSCVIVDAVEWPGMEPAEIRQLGLESFAPTARLAMMHQIDLPTALALGREMNRPMPSRVEIVAIRVEDALTLGEACLPRVRGALEPAAALTLRLARELTKSEGTSAR